MNAVMRSFISSGFHEHSKVAVARVFLVIDGEVEWEEFKFSEFRLLRRYLLSLKTCWQKVHSMTICVKGKTGGWQTLIVIERRAAANDPDEVVAPHER